MAHRHALGCQLTLEARRQRDWAVNHYAMIGDRSEYPGGPGGIALHCFGDVVWSDVKDRPRGDPWPEGVVRILACFAVTDTRDPFVGLASVFEDFYLVPVRGAATLCRECADR